MEIEKIDTTKLDFANDLKVRQETYVTRTEAKEWALMDGSSVFMTDFGVKEDSETLQKVLATLNTYVFNRICDTDVFNIIFAGLPEDQALDKVTFTQEELQSALSYGIMKTKEDFSKDLSAQSILNKLGDYTETVDEKYFGEFAQLVAEL